MTPLTIPSFGTIASGQTVTSGFLNSITASTVIIAQAAAATQGVSASAVQGTDAAGAQRLISFPATPTSGDAYTPPEYLQLGGGAETVGSGMLIRGQPYGYYDTGALVSLFATDQPLVSSRAGINGGFETGVTAMADYDTFDMVGLYEEIGTMAPRLVISGVTYDATHIYPPASTTFSAAQLAQLRRSMWVMTNSVDGTVSPTPSPANTTPPTTTYGSTVLSWSPTAIVVSGWTVPGSGHTASGQVPTAASPQTVTFGSPTKQFGRNLVINHYPALNPGCLTFQYEGEEVDLDDYGTKDYSATFHGITIQYTPYGISTTTGTNVKPCANSWGLHVGGPLPQLIVIDEIPTSVPLKANAFLFNGNQGPAGGLTNQHVLCEVASYVDGVNNMRLITYQQRDSGGVGWTTTSVHLALQIDGAQGSLAGNPMAQIVWNPAGALGCLSIVSATGNTGLEVIESGVVLLPNGVAPGGFTVATLPNPGIIGQQLYAIDGRKPGESAGSGSGVPVVCTKATPSATVGTWFSMFGGAAVTS